MTLQELNALTPAEAEIEFRKCCGTQAWVMAMVARKPFSDRDALFSAAESIWIGLGPSDWREAFEHHPRIGGTEELRKKFGSTSAWASEEQRGVSGASSDVIAALADGNRRYEARYGHIFLVCATGKSAAEMLAILEGRMKNSSEDELRIAAGEQAKITRIRLEKMIS